MGGCAGGRRVDDRLLRFGRRLLESGGLVRREGRRAGRAVRVGGNLGEPVLVLLDDHALFRESLARRLAAEKDIRLVAECATSTEALQHLRNGGADVILVDIAIAREFIPHARKAQYCGKFLAIARQIDAADSALVLKSGASGVFLDSDSTLRLLQAIRLVAEGEAWVDQKVIQLLADRYPHYDAPSAGQLTEREQTVLRGLVDGLSNRGIAARIGVSESAVKATLQQLFSKLGVRTRSQLVRIAVEGRSGD